MQKLSLAGLALLIAFHSFAWSGPDIQKDLHRSFEKTFPNAENVHWDSSDNGYSVSFTVKTVLTRINYNKKGKFTGSLRNYTEQLLPFYLTNIVKQKYPGQEIFGVTEITTTTDINYFIKLRSPKYWTTVRIDNDGNSSIVERYDSDKQ